MFFKYKDKISKNMMKTCINKLNLNKKMYKTISGMLKIGNL